MEMSINLLRTIDARHSRERVYVMALNQSNRQ